MLRKGSASSGSSDDSAFEEENAEAQRKYLYRKGCISMLVFFTFLMVFSLTVAMSQSTTAPLLAGHMREKFKPLESPPPGEKDITAVHSVDDFWEYLDTGFMRVMYGNQSVDTSVFGDRFTSVFRAIDTPNRVIGAIKLRQTRVKKNVACQISSMFDNYNVECYGPFTSYTESQLSYGTDNIFTYNNNPDGGAITGSLGAYPASGFHITLPYNAKGARDTFNTLRKDGFVDSATRAVAMDFNIWNTNSRDFAVCRLLFEFAPSGVVENSFRVLVLEERNVKPFSQTDAGGWIAVFGEFILVMFVLYYFAEEISEITMSRLAYFTDGWNVLDWTNLILLLISFGYKISVWISGSGLDIGMTELDSPDSYTELQGIAESIQSSKMINAFNAVLIWAKCTKYIGFLPYIRIVVATIGKSFKYFMSFLGMFGVLFFGFAVAFNIGFGDRISDLTSLGSTMVFLARAFLGDIDLFPIYDDTPFYGAILILLFVVVMIFLALNIFFAIIASGFFTTSDSEEEEEADFREQMMISTFNKMNDNIKNKCDPSRLTSACCPGVFRWWKRRQRRKMRARMIADGIDPDSYEREQQQLATQQSQGKLGVYEQGLPEDSKNYEADQVMRSVEHLAGRMLSKLTSMAFELTSEMREINDVMTGFYSAISILNQRVEDLQADQEDYLNE